jgi:hypothetical protein
MKFSAFLCSSASLCGSAVKARVSRSADYVTTESLTPHFS